MVAKAIAAGVVSSGLLLGSIANADVGSSGSRNIGAEWGNDPIKESIFGSLPFVCLPFCKLVFLVFILFPLKNSIRTYYKNFHVFLCSANSEKVKEIRDR